MIAHLPVLVVIIPMLASAISALMPSSRLAWLVATLASWASFGCMIMLAGIIYDVNVINYAMGGHLPPVGIEYRLDHLNVFVLLLVSFMGAVMLPYAKQSVEFEVAESKRGGFYSIYLLCLAGLLGIASTNDIFNIYVFLEISSLATYALIAMGKDRRALLASYQYLIIGTIGATFILIAIGMLYVMTGTLNMSDIAARIPDITDDRPVKAALAFLTLGLAMKVALFPLHMWLTNAYAFAPSFVSAFLASTATKVSAYLIIRMLYTVFGYEYSFESIPFGFILMLFAVPAILVGSLSAIFQHNVKRLFAFSSVAQMGYIALGLTLASSLGLMASILHIGNHAIAKGLLFLCVGAVAMRAGGFATHHFAGVGKEMRWTMACFVVGGLSLIGIPGTAGFISKWYLIMGLLERGWWPLVMLVIFSSLLAVIYVWKVIESAYLRPRPKGVKRRREVPLWMVVPMFVLAVANIWLGLHAELTTSLASQVSDQLFAVEAEEF